MQKEIGYYILNLSTLIFSLLIILTIYSCTQHREKAEGEILLSEVVYEEKGVYYKFPNTKETYTGSLQFYYDLNGAVRGEVTLLNGLPDGKWKYYHNDGSEDYTLYFDNGKLLTTEQHHYNNNKTSHLTAESTNESVENLKINRSHCSAECCVNATDYYFFPEKRVIKKEEFSEYANDTRVGTWVQKGNTIEMLFTDFYGGECNGSEIGVNEQSCQQPKICDQYQSFHKKISERDEFDITEEHNVIKTIEIKDIESYNWITLKMPYHYKKGELLELSKEDLRVKRNELFALYGYIFQSEDLKKHFSKMRWYKPLYTDIQHFLTDKDLEYIDMILKIENSL